MKDQVSFFLVEILSQIPQLRKSRLSYQDADTKFNDQVSIGSFDSRVSDENIVHI